MHPEFAAEVVLREKADLGICLIKNASKYPAWVKISQKTFFAEEIRAGRPLL